MCIRDRLHGGHRHRTRQQIRRGPGRRPLSFHRRRAILAPGYKPGSWQFRAYAEAGKFPVDVPVGEFTAEQRHALLYGEPEKVQYLGFNTTYQGLIPRLEAPFLSKEKEGFQKGAREFVDRAVTQVDCPACGGTRLA